MLYTIELTPSQKFEMEQALRERVRKLQQNADETSDPRLAILIRRRAAMVDAALTDLLEAEVA